MANTTSSRSPSFPWGQTTGGWLTKAQAGTTLLASEPFLILALVIVGLLTHGLHMFHYPASTFLDDEGIYAQQAWAVLRMQQLTPYTYFYDHAPGGWILLAAWAWISGGLRTFGSIIDSGRVLMLLLHLAMIPLLYHVTRKLSQSVAAAALAALLFSISPLAIFYQRMVLLDSMMLFWVLLSLDLLLDGWGRLSRIALSGVCFGLALLTKETAIFLLPALLFIVFHQRWPHQSRFSISGWVVPLLIVVSWYPFFALLKGELFPPLNQWANQPSGDVLPSAPRVSLLGALLWQVSRDGGGLFNFDNQFWQMVRNDWFLRDPLLLISGVVASGINLFRGVRQRQLLAAGLLGVLPLVYLGRGGVIFNFYILLAIPFFCLNIAVLAAPLFRRLPSLLAGVLILVTMLVLVRTYWQAGVMPLLYTERPDQAGRQAVSWIKQNIPAESVIIMRDDLWADLRENGLGGPAFPNVHSHWKVALDSEVRDGIFQNDWRKVDYLLINPDLDQEFARSNNAVALEALENARLVKRWAADLGRVDLHPHQILELWKVNKVGQTEALLLSASSDYLSRRFEQDGAYVAADGVVTSEAQAYAMLRAVWTDDRASFDRAWRWTQANLMDEGGLPAWLWQDGSIKDYHPAADADTDMALALLMASRRWGDQALLADGQRMVQAIWEREVVMIEDQPYLTAGEWATHGQIIALNPSYFAPYAYRIFQEVDPEHNWLGVVDSGYRLVAGATESPLDQALSAGLPPDWVGLNRETGELVPLEIDKEHTTRYSYDAARTYWRVALDWRWFQDGRAKAYMDNAGFLRDEVNRLLSDGITYKNRVSGIYAHDGTVVQEASSVVGTAGAMAALLSLDPAAANTLYAGQIVGGANRIDAGLYWDNPTDLYAQEWGWLATALYADALPNLWHAPQ